MIPPGWPILTALLGLRAGDFLFPCLRITGLTKGNLSSHLRS